MKKFHPFKWLLLIVIIVVAIPFIIIEELFRWLIALIGKIKLNYQFMMFIYQFTR
ncbi:MAG: hypothetical protein HYR66_09850 [Sphingobacteriales bacterium]|nr:hypothetical protein [Sphingobacteriales bacterium]